MTIAIPSAHFTRPAAIQTDRSRATSSAVSVKPIASAAAADLGVHPVPIVIGLASCTWFLLISWVCFAPLDRETAMMVGVVTVIFAMFLGGMTIGALYSSGGTGVPGRRSFREFLDGKVDTATGLISGRETMIQIAALPLTLAAGGTAMALIWTLIR